MNTLFKLLASGSLAAALSFGAAPTAAAQRGPAVDDAPNGERAHQGRRARGQRARGVRAHGHGRHRGHRHGMRHLMRQLDLSENQQAQVRAILEDAREQRHALREAGDREALRALKAETFRLVHEVLTPAQRERARALRAEHVDRRVTRMTRRLELSDAQASEIRTILLRAQPGQRGDVRARIEAVLTPEQRATIEARRAERGDRGPRMHRRGHRNNPQVGVDDPDNRGI